MKSLGNAVSKIAAPVLGRRGFGEAQMIFAWPSIVGAALALDTLPVKLSFAQNQRIDGVLHLRVAPGAAPTVQHLEPAILQRINGYFGYKAVARLALRQGPLPARETPRRAPPPPSLAPSDETKLASELSRVADPALRAAIERLGRRVIGTPSRLPSKKFSR